MQRYVNSICKIFMSKLCSFIAKEILFAENEKCLNSVSQKSEFLSECAMIKVFKTGTVI